VHVEVDGLRLFVDVLSPEYVTAGPAVQRRRTVVFVHGGIDGDSSNSREIGSRLAGGAGVVLVDRRGNGGSDGGGAETWTLDRFADDVHDVCVALGIVHPVVVGASYGGFIALRYAIRHPDHPAGLVVLSSGPGFDREALMTGWQRIEEGRNPEHTARIAERSARVVRRRPVDAYPRETLMLDLDLRPELPAITRPTLLVVGAEDPVFPAQLSHDIAERLGTDDVHVVEVPGAGHLLDMDAPDAVATEIRAFVMRLGPPPDPWAGGTPYTERPTDGA
jgi:proline iminopeptidase